MDCKTARNVWNHSDGFIAGVRKYLPGVVEHLERQIREYLAGKTNPFNAAVKRHAGDGSFYSEHADTEGDVLSGMTHDVVGDLVGKAKLEEYFSTKFGQPIHLGNMCCGACIISNGTLSKEHLERIQLAAVNTEPDGASMM